MQSPDSRGLRMVNREYTDDHSVPQITSRFCRSLRPCQPEGHPPNVSLNLLRVDSTLLVSSPGAIRTIKQDAKSLSLVCHYNPVTVSAATTVDSECCILASECTVMCEGSMRHLHSGITIAQASEDAPTGSDQHTRIFMTHSQRTAPAPNAPVYLFAFKEST